MDFFGHLFDSSTILRKKKSLKRQLLERDSFIEKRIAILSGSTIGDIKDVLELFLLEYGIKPDFFIGQYARFYEEIVFEEPKLIDFNPELIFIHTSIHNLSDNEDLPDKLRSVWAKIRSDFSCPIIQNNFELPIYSQEFDCHNINALNMEISDYAKEHKGFYINDVQFLSAYFGLSKWFSEKDYYLYKYPFGVNAVPLFCHNLAKIIKSLYGKNQKCLVLDLDNTLWGGIVGDVGISAIELGMETVLGEAYVAFQKYVKALHKKGVILAVCSKNDEQIAKEAFANPNMVLTLDDITVFCANWNNKAENIIKIANQLNILPESLVFIDDNPAERELVRSALPDVKIPEVDSVIDFIRHIENAGYFYTTAISDEDAKRNKYYAADLKRKKVIDLFVSYDDYLRSLKMSSDIKPFDAASFDRIAQLINKTNQFNLTTVRYSLPDVEKFSNNPDFITLYATLDDKFGSNGIVSVLIGEIVESALHLRLWIMSCRVFKRDLEYAIFDYLVKVCRSKDIEKLIGYYFKTEKNGYVSDLFDKLEFDKISSTEWEFKISDSYTCRNKHITTNHKER